MLREIDKTKRRDRGESLTRCASFGFLTAPLHRPCIVIMPIKGRRRRRRIMNMKLVGPDRGPSFSLLTIPSLGLSFFTYKLAEFFLTTTHTHPDLSGRRNTTTQKSHRLKKKESGTSSEGSSGDGRGVGRNCLDGAGRKSDPRCTEK